MKYKDPSTGGFKEVWMKVSDTTPIGMEADYNGTEVPSGWEEIPPIIESGNNDYGDYIKFEDGTMICTRKIDITANINNAWGSLFYWHNNDKYNFALEFVDAPVLEKNAISTNGIGFIIGDYGTGSKIEKDGFSGLSLIRPAASTNVQVTFDIVAIGKWK